MKLAASIENRIGQAALLAAFSMLGMAAATDLQPMLAESLAEPDGDWQPEVHFLCMAGDVPPEALYRFMAAKSRHLLPHDGWLGLDSDVRNFFEYFAVVAKALVKVLAPPDRAAITVLTPEQNRVPVSDTIFERVGRTGGRIGGDRLDPSTPISTASVPVTRNAPAGKPFSGAATEAAQDRLPQDSFEPVQIGPDIMEAYAKGVRPSDAEFMAMSPEERRPWAALMGKGSTADEFDIAEALGVPLVGAPPAIDGETEVMSIDQTVGGEHIAGAVKVTRSKTK